MSKKDRAKNDASMSEDSSAAGDAVALVRARLESSQAAIKERFDEPIERATQITQRTLAWFPIRVWRHFLQHNGFVLAAGISYQSLFTIFAAIALAFGVVGIWLGGDPVAVDQLIDIINSYIPGIISEHGLVTPEQVRELTAYSGTSVTIASIIAAGVIVWTSIGFVTFARKAVRDTFGLTYDARSYVLLKARDLLAASTFGVALLAGSLLVQITTWALDLALSLFGWDLDEAWTSIGVRLLTLVVAFAINTVALAGLFRFLTGTSIPWHRIWPGSILGGAALAVMQFGAGLLLRYSPSNPLLATFTIFIGFLLWFRLNGIVLLVSAAWIAVATTDRNQALVVLSDEDRERLERNAVAVAAQARLRHANERVDDASWWQQPMAKRERRLARQAVNAAGMPDEDTRRSLGLLD